MKQFNPWPHTFQPSLEFNSVPVVDRLATQREIFDAAFERYANRYLEWNLKKRVPFKWESDFDGSYYRVSASYREQRAAYAKLKLELRAVKNKMVKENRIHIVTFHF